MNDTTNKNDNQWPAVLEALKGSLTKGQYDTHFLGSTARFDGSTLEITLPASANVEMVEKRLSGGVSRSIKSVTGEVYRLRFVGAEAKPVFTIDDPMGADEPDEAPPEMQVNGVYHDQRNAFIQPDKVEVHSQYFRKKWRPLLGPLCSELIRELRQRCHKQTGRNRFRTTYKSLAASLGVSEPTIQRLLARDDEGKFSAKKAKYLSHFIANMETLHDGSGDKIHTVGTLYTIYLDEPLTPDDQEEMTKYQNDV